ncbi:unnamed protein product [Blepharisma stoltei]|uniref:Uncharacterized protein n=1 Tax=Blepharisma stoltei TaxID=1481888 RepID=A0AAU9IPR6_9CILI|nr:unnamed protein product [Blepharisma stoltei]
MMHSWNFLNFSQEQDLNENIIKEMGILEKILEKPVENLLRSNIPPPNREALLLFREYLKFASCLTWCHTDGTPWSKIIKTSIRAEFEAAREEKDPLIQGQLIVSWRQALDELKHKYNDAQHAFVQRIHDGRTDNKRDI